MGFIYRIYNDVNDKSYIGQTTRTVEWRFNGHLKEWDMRNATTTRPLYKAMLKYGKDKFHVEQLEECDDSLLDEREIYYIEKYGSYGHNGYNATRGGSGGRQLSDDQIKEVFSLWNSGSSILEIFNKTNISSKWLSNLLRENNIATSEEIKERGEAASIKKDNSPTQIICYDLNYNVIGLFSSLKKASEYCINKKIAKGDVCSCKSNIRYTCYGIKKSAYGLNWKFANFDLIDNYCGIKILDLPDKEITHKCVIQLTKDNKFINEYFSTVKASDILNIKYKNIQAAANPKGPSKTAYGFKWLYLEDYQKLHPEYVSKFKK